MTLVELLGIWKRALLCVLMCGAHSPSLGAQENAPADLAYQLATRYAPYANTDSMFDLDLLAEFKPEVWWSTPTSSSAFARPLDGLHLAIDPGHIGGIWAAWEGRNFRMCESDYWVREGELVLEVAFRIREQLIALGAEVTLLRDSFDPVNPKRPIDYWEAAAAEIEAPQVGTLAAQIDYALAIRNRAIRLAIVVGELAERARLVNEVIRPDALISLHINAAPWLGGEVLKLVESDHAHVLIFGCMSDKELASTRQQTQLIQKLTNGSGGIERQLGASIGQALAEATKLPASEYEGQNAIRIDQEHPYLWARNLMLLRLVDCPTVLLEPYISNSRTSYVRIQEALQTRAQGDLPGAGDILVEYSDAVVRGVMDVYGAE